MEMLRASPLVPLEAFLTHLHGLRSQDRTEPPIGAKVLSDLVKKFGAECKDLYPVTSGL